MSPNLHSILKAFAKELISEVTAKVTEQLRETYVNDITTIVKSCLNKVEIYKGTNTGFLPIATLCNKYKVSRKTVNNKCTLFGVGRKRVGRHNLVNEQQFLDAHDRPVEKPKFLSRQKAA